MAQQAKPNVSGQMLDLRAQSMKKSTVVRAISPPAILRYLLLTSFGVCCRMMLPIRRSLPFEGALAPGVGQPGQKEPHESHDGGEALRAQGAEVDGPGEHEEGLH